MRWHRVAWVFKWGKVHFCPTLNNPPDPHLPTHHLMPFLVSDATSFDGSCGGRWLITQNLDRLEFLERFADDQPWTLTLEWQPTLSLNTMLEEKPAPSLSWWQLQHSSAQCDRRFAPSLELMAMAAQFSSIWEVICNSCKVIAMAAQLTDLLVSTAEVSNLLSFLAVLGGLLVMMAFIIRMLYQVNIKSRSKGLNTLGFVYQELGDGGGVTRVTHRAPQTRMCRSAEQFLSLYFHPCKTKSFPSAEFLFPSPLL